MTLLRELPGFGIIVDGLSWAIGTFDNKDLAFAIAMGILVLAALIFIFLHFRGHRRWVKPIRRLSATLKKMQETDDDAEMRLIQADKVFEAENKLFILWREYRKHLIKNPKAPGYLNLIDPKTWFSLESLPGRGYEHWCSTWAGVFLTIGLLFTFIGLSAALLKVGGIDGGDSAAMKAAITGILGVSSAKFITSIAGLIAYIFFSLVTRRYQASQQTAVLELTDAIQHLSMPLTPEILLYEQNETASRQLTRMERLTDDLAVAIDAKLEQRLKVLSTDFGVHLGSIQQDLPKETSKPIVKALDDLADHLGSLKDNLPRETNAPIVQAIEKMTQDIASEFSRQVQQTAGGEIDTVVDRFTAVAQELASIKGGMGEAGKSFGNDIGAAARILSEAAEKMGAGLDNRSERLALTIGQFGGKLDNILASLSQVPSDISQALNSTLNRLTEAVEALMVRLTQGGQDGGDALREGGQQAGREIENAVERAGSEFDRQVAQATNQLVVQFGTAQASLQGAINELTNRLNMVESSLKTLPGAVAAQVQNLNAAGQTFQTAGQAVTAASGALQQSSQPLLQTAATITTGLGELLQGVEKAADIQEQTSKACQAALEGLKRAAEAAERTFKTHEDRFGRADIDLAKAVESLRAGVEQVARETQGVFAEYENHITSIVSSLGGVASELQEVAEEMVAARQVPAPTQRRYP
jgi:hypothetical protein